MWDRQHSEISNWTVENHSQQLIYVNHFDVWIPGKIYLTEIV